MPERLAEAQSWYVKVVGYGGLATAAAAWYVAAADVINDAFGYTVSPLERVGKRTVRLQ